MALQADAAGNIDVNIDVDDLGAPARPRPFALPATIARIPKVTFGAARLLVLIGVASTIVAVTSLTVLGGTYYLLISLAR